MNAVDRFTSAAAAVGLTPDVQRFPEGTRTAADAAAAVGCAVGQIVKSLIFLVVAIGILRLDRQFAASIRFIEIHKRGVGDA